MRILHRHWGLILTLAVIITGGLVALFKVSRLAVGNAWFMLGLFFLVGAAFFILEKGRLLAGWRRRKRRGEEALHDEVIPVHQVASAKNGPIVVNRQARFCLIVGVILIVLSVLMSG